MTPQKVIYIYPDVAFAVSLIMNFVILWGTARLNKEGSGSWRLAGGAVYSAFYSFAAAFPQMSVLQNFWLKFLFSVSIVAAVFLPLSFKRFVATTVIFYLMSFTLGGVFFGIIFFLSSSSFYYGLSNFSGLIAKYFYPGIILTLLIYVVGARFIGRLLRKRLSQSLFVVPVRVLFGESAVEVSALIDTGNRLEDPLSRVPVIVIEYDAIKSLMPPEVRKAFEINTDPDLMVILDSIAHTPWSRRFRVIPFTSLGKENGLLVGFKPDRLEIFSEGIRVSTNNVIVGVYRQELSPEGHYKALLHPELLELVTA